MLFTQRAIYETLSSAPQFDPPDKGEFVLLHDGLTMDDPLQPIAASMSPAQMQAAVLGGARGASLLSPDAVDHVGCLTRKDQTQLCSTVRKMEEMLFGVASTVSCCDGDGDGTFCVPGWIPLSNTTYGPWSAPTPTAGGGCSYSRTATTSTKMCYEHWDCHLTDCHWLTPTSTFETRVCPAPPGGTCPPAPTC